MYAVSSAANTTGEKKLLELKDKDGEVSTPRAFKVKGVSVWAKGACEPFQVLDAKEGKTLFNSYQAAKSSTNALLFSGSDDSGHSEGVDVSTGELWVTGAGEYTATVYVEE